MARTQSENLLRSYIPRSLWRQIKRAAELAEEHRRRIAEGDFSVFRMPFVFAIAKDGLLDLFSKVPLVGLLITFAFSFPVAVYLFIFMWGRGKWKVRLFAFFATFFDFIPFINLIPWETVAVWYAYHLTKRDADAASAALSDMEHKVPILKRKLQTQTARMARAVALREERMSQQAVAGSEVGASAESADTSERRSAQPLQLASFPRLGNIAPRAAATLAVARGGVSRRPMDGGAQSMPTMSQKILPQPTGQGEAQTVSWGINNGRVIDQGEEMLASPKAPEPVMAYGFQNKGYGFSKEYSKKWRQETAGKLREAQRGGAGRENQREILKKFYNIQEEQADNFKQDIAAGKRDVKQLSTSHKSLFLHGVPVLREIPTGMTEPSRNTAMNNPLFDSTKMGHLERVGGIVSVQPTISVFTRRVGQKEPIGSEEAFYPVGVILGGGSVLSAYGGDAGTITHGLRERYSKYDQTLWSSVQENIDVNIKKSLKRDQSGKSGSGGTNEIIVEKPEIKAAYVYIRPTQQDTEAFRVANPGGHEEYLHFTADRTKEFIKGALEISKKYGVPAYLITHNGEVRDLLDMDLRPVSVEFVMAGTTKISSKTKLADAEALLSRAVDSGVRKDIEQKIEAMRNASEYDEGQTQDESIMTRVDTMLGFVDPSQALLEGGVENFIQKNRDSLTTKESLLQKLEERGVKERAILKAKKIFETAQSVKDCEGILAKLREERQAFSDKITMLLRDNSRDMTYPRSMSSDHTV